jgi:NAD(P)-dependent dehydrogenase (short-subunit alcohol dehydrogenase family)
LGPDGKLDYLLNNAAINGVPDQTSLDLNEADLQQHISINVFGPAKTVQVLLPHLQKGSVVMNMASPSPFNPRLRTDDFPRLPAWAVSSGVLPSLGVRPTASAKLH